MNISADMITNGLSLCKQRHDIKAVASMDIVYRNTSCEFSHVPPAKAHSENFSFKNETSTGESSADTPHISTEGTPDAAEKSSFFEPGSLNRAQNQECLIPLTLCMEDYQSKFLCLGMCDQGIMSDSNAATKSEHETIHNQFERQVALAPEAIALVHEDQSLNYAELNARANRLAHHLIGLGIQPDERVAICMERSPEMIIGLLAILKAGGAYVPIDPAYPSERFMHILSDASPVILLADNAGQQALGETILASLTIVDPSLHHETIDSNPYVPGLTPCHLAYVMYTSGSTGKPKGVMIEHRSVVNMAHSHTTTFGVHQGSRVLQFAAFSFDSSVSEIFMALSCGASLYLPPESARFDRSKLWEYLDSNSITYASFTPSVLQDGKDLPSTSKPLTLVLGGEALSAALLQRLACHGPVFNDYGPTEATVSAVVWRASHDFSGDIVPIGRPHKNYRIHLLDAHMQLVPLGVMGEIYIGGVGVARGYLNRPDLTAERFLPDPFVGDAEARMYKTGDLARYLPDGNLVYLGRDDDQVKIRGIRIETSEIEARLAEHAQVQEVAVIAFGEEIDKRLVAYVVSTPVQHLAHELRLHLTTRLPEYMIPAAFVRLNALPLNINGKLDRSALPIPHGDAFARQAYEAPQGVEVVIAAIWAQLLGVEHISRHDNFFGLGGHSLLVVRVLERLHRLGLSVPVRTLFESPTLSELAHALSAHQAVSTPPNLITLESTALTPDMLPLIELTQGDICHIIQKVPGGIANIQDIYALSSLQHGILFHHVLTTEGDPYLSTMAMAFQSRVLLDRYLSAFQRVIDRHDILRTMFIWENLSAPAQVVCRRAPLPILELTLNPADGPIMEQLDIRFNPGHYQIDLRNAPLVRFVVAQDIDGRWLLLQLMHHLVGDHAAAEMMNIELQSILEGQDQSLPTPRPFRNLVAQARSKSSPEAHEHFFKGMLADVDEPTLPFGLAGVYNNGSKDSESHQMLPENLNVRLRSQAKRLGVSLASMCHVAWAQVLARTSGQERVVFGTVLSGQLQAAGVSDQAMGLSINTLPFRCDMDKRDVKTCIQETHSSLAALLEHEYAPLALAQKCSGVPPGTALFSGLLNYRHTSLPASNSSRATAGTEFWSQEERVHYPGIEFLGGQERTNYPFTLSVEDFGTHLGLTVQVIHTVSPARVLGYMQRTFESLVEALECKPNLPVSHLQVLPTEECDLLLRTWNKTQQDYPEYQCIHHLFEKRAAHTPEAIALVHEDQSLNYAELNARANRLAHHLIGLGIQPDERVAICMERSPEMIIGLLAILKAGGAYVPIDPAYPSERFMHILSDASPVILLADNAGQQALGETILASLTIVDPSLHHETIDSNPYVPGLTPCHLAYVMYTSGSTGKPKGVMIEHRSVVNMAHSHITTFGIHQGSRVLQFAAFSFDASVAEIFMALSCGASLYLPPDSARFDRSKLWEYLDSNSITYAAFTPSVLQDGKDLPSTSKLLTLVLGGEALSAALLQRLACHNPVFNYYGPTETTVSAVAWRASHDFSGDIVPIGRPHKNYRIYLLDTHMQLVPLGVMGEIYIGGVGVARGYLNRPDLTAERFFPDPFVGDAEARMYKTGDLARYLPDGNLVYLGRNDDQVKIRGIRIETGEIEARLAEHAQVQEVAVIAFGEEIDKRLVAYVVSTPVQHLAHELRLHLTTRLPEYMIPAAFVRLDALPLNINGKLDRRALPKPSEDAFARQAYEAPKGEIEAAISNIWMDLLKVDKIGRHDGFFMLGGHSLLALRMIDRLRSMLGLDMTPRMLFEAQTIAELAKRIFKAENTQEGSYEVLLPIKPQGTRRPLFCVHHAFGTSWCYIRLSAYLPTDQPVYGLQARGLFGDEQLPTTLDDMATDYILQIRSIQPHGPYYLLGYSFGGTVVHTMAKLLEEQGERVALVVLMDTPSDYHIYPFGQNEDDAGIIRSFAGGNEDVTSEEVESFWENAPKIVRNNGRLASQRAPPIYGGDVLLVRATELQEDMRELIYGTHWEPYVRGDIETVDIPCTHDGMEHPGPMAEVGRILAQKLEALHGQEIRKY